MATKLPLMHMQKKTKTKNISHLRNDSGYMIVTAEPQWS
jgi:hypothetical protein